ncbi:hypothetical protein LGH70_21030 [Hymenobacter sp. BT635]|uniref:DUF4136 domain-containing protein n=1 Tax=Hymenobacter nitidus TaxID=2880929 RepID=A0ABS8AJB1_9BACT|nr:hypothetical protein [Hymenobacter nitidus]MCB2380092.1 hypothetical protein [Hymenobacter nitidus]
MRALLLLACAFLFGCAGSYKPLKGWSPWLSAGSPVIHCYGRLLASDEEIRYALRLLWERYPENRITAADMREMSAFYNASSYHYDTINHQTGRPFTEEDAFRHQLKGDYKKPRYTWGLKTANNRIICSLGIANANELCLQSVTFLPVTKTGGNWELTREERARAQTWFEEDILAKLSALIKETRKKVRVQG